MKIAILQMNSTLGEIKTNLEKIDAAATAASNAGAELLICPELAITGYGAGNDLRHGARKADHEGLEDICAISKKSGVAIITGYSEKTGTGYANSAVFIVDGDVKSNYQKCQLWGEYERQYFTAAQPSAVIADYKGLRIGMLICYDVEFPERVRALAKEGVDLIAVPTATPLGHAATFIAEKMLPVRAFENQTHIAYVNHHSNDGRFDYAGLSCVAAPDGSHLVQAPPIGDALLYADIDPQKYAEFCKETPYLNDLVEG